MASPRGKTTATTTTMVMVLAGVQAKVEKMAGSHTTSGTKTTTAGTQVKVKDLVAGPVKSQMALARV